MHRIRGIQAGTLGIDALTALRQIVERTHGMAAIGFGQAQALLGDIQCFARLAGLNLGCLDGILGFGQTGGSFLVTRTSRGGTVT